MLKLLYVSESNATVYNQRQFSNTDQSDSSLKDLNNREK